VVRNVDRCEGLGLIGRASIGPIPVSTPALLESRPSGPPGSGLTLQHEPGPSGTRALVLSAAGSRVELRLPVLAPEVAGAGSGVYPIADRALLLHPPFQPEAAAAARTTRPELLVLGNGRTLWEEGAPFLTALREVRARFGAAPLLWVPRVALPHRLALLAYLGVDLVDTTEGLIRAARGDYLDPALGVLDRTTALAERRCGCPSCAADPPGSTTLHAESVYRSAMAETRTAARSGHLRELVEARLVAEPALAEMLRYADRDLAGVLEERSPVIGEGTHDYVLAESHRRPEMVRFRARLLERYRPPPSKTVLLLVPCSKTKPYRRSRSHRRFTGALDGLRPLERVHLVSVSSPIGVVPRELEDVPPARHYDIPVTGDWTESERGFVRAGIDHLVHTGHYQQVIVHLDPVEYGFLREWLPKDVPVRWTLSDDRTTSAAGLGALRAAVAEALSGATAVEGGPLAVVREELRELASLQFGRDAADRLFVPPVRLAGRPWFQRVTDGSTDLATVREERGLFQLTVAGARRLGPPFPLGVEVDPGLVLSGDLFVPGVRAADPRIRAGDAVVLLRRGALAGVGEAELSGPLMTELERGVAVRVRHRVHPSTDTPMTEERSSSTDGPVVQR
jgi:archaeosine synthase alpha-subunit